MSTLINLECSQCEMIYDAHRVQTFCTRCISPLLARYELAVVRTTSNRDQLRSLPRGMWRWQPLLPVDKPEYCLTLGEGDTPLLPLNNLARKIGCSHLYVKDESFNPTGTFKARGLAAAISRAGELGLNKFIIPTAGNAGSALAAYAARGGFQACIVMPEDTPHANLEECRRMGAEVILVDGLISDAAKLSQEKSVAEGWFDVSTFKEPYRLEGKKIMGFELAESMDWELPDVIIYPTGGGTGLVGMWKAFTELRDLGWLSSNALPRMISVQASGCAPIVAAYESGKPSCEFWVGAQTIASGLRVPKSFADKLILRIIRESQGCAISVSDSDILDAQSRLAKAEGIFAAPEGAATLAGLFVLLQRGLVQPDERIVLFNTGSGLKYL